jgi:hypothetical protein
LSLPLLLFVGQGIIKELGNVICRSGIITLTLHDLLPKEFLRVQELVPVHYDGVGVEIAMLLLDINQFNKQVQ